VIVSVPDTFVPLGLAGPVGLNVTDTVQVAGFGANVVPQVFALTANCVLGAIEVMLIAVLFGFDSVTVLGGEIVLTCTLPNDIFFGLMPILSPAADASTGAATMMTSSRIEMTALFAVSIAHLAPPGNESQQRKRQNDEADFLFGTPPQTCAKPAPFANKTF
jgi:hypothetical protein